MTLAVEELYQVIDERTRALIHMRSGERRRLHRRGWLVRRGLLVADVLGLTLAFAIAEAIYGPSVGDGRFSQVEELFAFATSLPLWIVAAKMYRLYDQDEKRTDHSTTDDFGGVFHLVTVGTFVLFVFARASHWFNPQFWKLFIFWALAVGAVTSARVGARTYCRRRVEYLQNTIIVGAGDVGQNVARRLLYHPEYGLNVVGFVDANPKELVPGLEHITILGTGDDLPSLVELLDVERVIVAFSNERDEDMLESMRRLNAFDVQLDIIPRLFESLGPSIGLHAIEGMPVVGLPPARLRWSSLLLKRAMDVVLAGIGLVLLLPFFVLLALLVKRDSDGPVLYQHERVGRGRKPVGVYKFRTMRREACRGDAYGGVAAEEEFERLMEDPLRRLEFATSYKLQDDPRVTRVGRLLRRWSLDELPQLINVVKGDLSLVGPRPLTAEELELYYGRAADDLLQIRPGITGYWQINGRSDLFYDDRVRLDLAYLRSWSVRLDLEILAKTIRILLTHRGAA